MAGITGGVRSVRQIFKDDYSVGEFQRGYTWNHEHAATLVRDLERAFERRKHPDVSGEYYLGAVVTHNRFGFHHIVDGQQRLTTLLLLLIWLYHELSGRDRRRAAILAALVRHDTPSRAAFAIDVQEREPVLLSLFDDPDSVNRLKLENDTDRTIASRYSSISESFPFALRTDRLPAFVDWLLDKVVVAKIEADKEADAYTIFETTNDRGQKLGTAQLLKNFLQARIEDPDERDAALTAWARRMRELQRFGAGGDIDFVIQWLRARYAVIPAVKDHVNDFSAIEKDHFGWVKDNAGRMGLTSSASAKRFMTEEFELMQQLYVRVKDGGEFPDRGLDSLFFVTNLIGGMSPLMRTVVLAGVDPDAPLADTVAIMRASATFVELLIARLAWQSFSLPHIAKHEAFLGRAVSVVRGAAVKDAVLGLQALAREFPVDFSDKPDAGMPRAPGPRPRQIAHSLLARMSACLDEAFNDTAAYQRYEVRSKSGGYTIEHVLPNDSERAKRLFETTAAYEKKRNRLAALVLIRAADNHALDDMDFSSRVEIYANLSRLARTFHPSFYTEETRHRLDALGLEFAACEDFGKDELAQRQLAYQRLAELTWSPDRIAFAARPNAGDDARVYALPFDRHPGL